ncbi:phosphoglucosamine mutase [Synechococcus elongatus]|uniref:Phosphoglucosamine mutase n=2 Tax=Synechococcus elongatus TaxID=32046 RepID=GLMM_SYNE7|nr:phosphoglucosamine mutase [Synechococcus elongatus]Q31LA7.1 RecName: Full=Phosphoglucosamine mutase [Synechococcus elongatus PCC 7942 = FACHB-805]ABB58162.1 phosphoglucosamine mutase [Synechococcus elongatus PCC 7942 = FACHB-805]AJD57361.1 phosphoglucosamine mutase [Synechococcus elongatus UTEX 2973]MBD2586882.1 phosphoglucosamine mutase [Synechococcus elongatus FACHB-242]MBD2687953.1 phosphoglucosamine mutase [Synechococcus elongatus FACHB-1061]MBD2706336.1 phosphoglucosamine mutase [Syne
MVSATRWETAIEVTPWIAAIAEQVPLFGTDGIRGRVGEHLTAPLAQQVGFWTGQVLRQAGGDRGPVVVGQDSRNSSNMLAMALSSGLAAAGVEVLHLGLCPTPGVAYLTHHSEAIGGVMISASHNPPGDNGIKVFGADGSKLDRQLQAAIEAGLRGQQTSLPATTWGQHYYQPQLADHYQAAIAQSLGQRANLQGLKIVLDLAWGAAALLAPRLFRELGAEVIALHDLPDGNQINVNCGSTHLARLQAAVLEQGADMGFAFDGDADRVLAVDGRGRSVDGDHILFLWGRELEQQQQLPGQAIVTTVMANLGFERAWQAVGGEFVRTAVGDQYVQAEMQARGAMLGGEQSGHILCRHYALTGDGTLTAAHVAALVQASGVSLADLVDQSFRPYPQLLRNVRVEDRDRRCNWQNCAALTQAIAAAETDMGDRGRVLVRASGTEPLLRIMVEAEEAQQVEHWTTHLVQVAESHLL